MLDQTKSAAQTLDKSLSLFLIYVVNLRRADGLVDESFWDYYFRWDSLVRTLPSHGSSSGSNPGRPINHFVFGFI